MSVSLRALLWNIKKDYVIAKKKVTGMAEKIVYKIKRNKFQNELFPLCVTLHFIIFIIYLCFLSIRMEKGWK